MTDSEWTDYEYQLLAELIDGKRSVDDPEVVELLAARPDAREELDAIRSMANQLDTAGGASRAEIDAASGQPLDAVDRRAAEAVFDSASTTDSSPGRSRSIPWRTIAVAAAVAVIGILLWGEQPADPSTPDDQILGEVSDNAVLVPRGRGVTVTAFRWPQPPPPGEAYRIEIFDARGKPRATPFVVSPSCFGTTWTPTPKQLAAIEAVSHFWWRRVLEETDGTESPIDGAEVWQ